MNYEETVSFSDDTNECTRCGVLYEGYVGLCSECEEAEEEPDYKPMVFDGRVV